VGLYVREDFVHGRLLVGKSTNQQISKSQTTRH
jgi:hypothetical protein